MQFTPAFLARTRGFVFASCLALYSGLAAVAAPLNNQCAGATVIPGTGPFPYLTQQLDLTGADNLGDPPLPPSGAPNFFNTNVSHSVWYKFTPALSGLYTISTGFDTDTTLRDTTMVMYTAASDCSQYSIFSYNEDSGTLRAAISTNLVAGTRYYIVVWIGPVEVITNQAIELQLRVTKPAVPSNDDCGSPLVIPSMIQSAYFTTNVDTTLATTAANVSPPCVVNPGSFPSRDVWYQFTPSLTGTYNFSTGEGTKTLINDTAIAIYKLVGGCQFADQVACSDNGVGRAVLPASLSANTTYHIAIWDNAPTYIPGETDLQLRVAPAGAPTNVVTLPPTNISMASVTLSGLVNANGRPTRFWFEWGPTTNLGMASVTNLILSSATTLLTNAMITGHLPNTLYYYRLVATNNLGRGQGELQTFLFYNTPPLLVAPGRDFNTFHFEFVGHTNHLYRVEASTNLVDWLDLGLANEESPGSFEFMHSLPVPVSPYRYYRVRLP
jgi:hypothetical protein